MYSAYHFDMIQITNEDKKYLSILNSRLTLGVIIYFMSSYKEDWLTNSIYKLLELYLTWYTWEKSNQNFTQNLP